jgi:hypothetical protein
MLIFLAAEIAASTGSPIWLTQQKQGTFPVCGRPKPIPTMGLAWQFTTDSQGHTVLTAMLKATNARPTTRQRRYSPFSKATASYT